VAVLGAGTMGQGIAQVAASCGFKTCLFDAAPEKAALAIQAIDKQLTRLVEKGKIQASERSSTLSLLSHAPTIGQASKDAELVIEAAPENMDLKVKILNEAKATALPTAVLASNTSSLSLTELGTRTGEAHRVIGLHFFNPPPIMELLEVVRGLSTSQGTVDSALAFAADFKKSPIVVNDSPGFASSRLGVMLGAEAIRMVESGVASAADIDRAMELGYRHPMGPLKLTDLVGLDVRLAILEHLHEEVGEQFRPPPLLRTMVRAGKLGKKTGEGFYVWKDGVPEAK
ncbi:MAG: 3-hydroxyacyl-CoA dehydrogenase family protein, partial [Polyangiaceae bacterium]